MIQQKLKPCKTCLSPSYIFSHGNCKYCSQMAKIKSDRGQATLTQTEDGRTAKAFKVYSTKAIKQDKSKTVEQLQQKSALTRFYEMQQVPERCENCNRLLMAYSTWAKRSVIAHILPKRDNMFPEVATNPNNAMFLGIGLFSDCNCHTNYDNNDAEYRKKMPCYKLAVKRYEAFVNELSEPQQIKADKYLGL